MASAHRVAGWTREGGRLDTQACRLDAWGCRHLVDDLVAPAQAGLELGQVGVRPHLRGRVGPRVRGASATDGQG